MTQQQEFDYIIVGAGSAGCVLAYRLSEDPAARVLVIEAGGRDTDPLIHIPIGMGKMHAERRHDWGYDAEPEPRMNGRVIEAMRGKVVGGSSSINVLAYVRGNRGDYDRWRKAGAAAGPTPMSCRISGAAKPGKAVRTPIAAGDGPLNVISARTTDPMFDAWFEAGRAAGYSDAGDYNGAQQEGFGRSQSTIRDGRRCSAAVAFLRPALKRPNVTLVVNALATRVLLDGARATGIEFSYNGETRRAVATREVILSGGVFNSPQLLMLSGIGPADHLRDVGIEPVVDLPNVGRNLQDHLAAMLTYYRPLPGPFHREMRFDRVAVSMVRAHLFGTGPATVLPSGLHGFIKTRPEIAVPDIQFIFRGTSGAAGPWFPGFKAPYRDGCAIRPVLLHPDSRGEIRLRSADPRDPVRIVQNFLATEADLRTLRDGIRAAREVASQGPLGAYLSGETTPGPDVKTDDQIDDHIRATAITAHHPSCTCAMGAGEDAVLDPELRVRGIEQLRVVDAAAMPDLVSGNINACVLMIAEKASDMILGRPPLPAAAV